MRLGKYILKIRILKLATFYIERVDFRCDDNLGYTVNVRSLCRQHTYEVILVFAQARLWFCGQHPIQNMVQFIVPCVNSGLIFG